MLSPHSALQPLLLVGLHYLKHTFNESDESCWVENPYWQCFCGFENLQHEVQLHSTALTNWRQRAGAENLVAMLEKTVLIAVNDMHINNKELAQVTVDITVQEKNVTHPTDSKRYLPSAYYFHLPTHLIGGLYERTISCINQ